MMISKHLTWLFVAVSAVLVGCEPTDKRAVVSEPLAYLDAPDTILTSQWERISEAAYKTLRKCTDSSNRSISEEIWDEAIQELKPIRVYIESYNVVIVLRESAGIEEGLYAHMVASSYIPSPDDFETLDYVYAHDPNGGICYGSIYRYRKKKENPIEIETLVSQIGTVALSQAGGETSRKYAQTIKTPGKNIHSKFWAEEIQRLIPVRVYNHRGNIAVVLRESSHLEEGVYIYILICSYFPRSGDDGFTFTNLGDSVFKYTRDLK